MGFDSEDNYMSLRQKTLLILLIPLVLIVIAIGYVRIVLLDSIQKVERQEEQANLHLIESAQDYSISSLERTAQDWAKRETIVQFLSEKNSSSLPEDLSPTTLQNLHISFVVFSLADGKIIQSMDDSENHPIAELSQNTQNLLAAYPELFAQSPPTGKTSGLILLPKGPAIISSVPVWSAGSQSSFVGTLMMGIYIDDAYLHELGSLTHLNLTIYTSAKPGTNPQIHSFVSDSTEQSLIQPVASAQKFGELQLSDIHHQSIGVIQVTDPQPASLPAIETVNLLLLVFLFIVSLIPLFVLIYLEKSILSRIRSIIAQIQMIGNPGSNLNQVTINGKDEISQLVRELNSTLSTLVAYQAALRESEDKFRMLAETTSAAIFIIQGENYRYLNPASEKIFGYHRDDMLKMKFWEPVHPSYQKRVKEWGIARQKGVKLPKRYPLKIVNQNGDERWIDLAAGLIEYKGQKATLCTALDITHQRRTEDILKRYQLLSENSHDIILFVRLSDGRIIEANRAAVLCYGYTRNELLSMTLAQMDIHGKAPPALVELAKNGSTGTMFEVEHVTKSGRLLNLECNAESTVIGGEHILLCILRNITERKITEDKIRESERKFRETLEKVQLISIELDREGTILFCNDYGSELTGWNKAEMLGKNWFTLCVPQNPSARKEYKRMIADQMMADQSESEIRLRDGTLRFISWKHICLKDRDNTLLGCESIGEDITERRKNEKQIQNQIQRMAALRTVDLAISSNFDLRFTLKVLIEQLITLLKVDAVCIQRINPQTHQLSPYIASGFLSNSTVPDIINDYPKMKNLLIDEWDRISIPDLADQNEAFSLALKEGKDQFKSYFALPLVAKGNIKGIIEIYNHTPLVPDGDWCDLVENLAMLAAIALDNDDLFGSLHKSNQELTLAYESTLEGWARALELRDRSTEGHTRRVADMAEKLSRYLGIDEDTIVHIRRGALLHDIGKMGIPDNVLLKTGPLTLIEWEVMRNHPVYAYKLLSNIDYLQPDLDIPYCHHERWDGSGYPQGLKGEQIPVSARIFSVVDVYDALSTDRPYRKAWEREKIIEYMAAKSGVVFDPKVVTSFIRMMRSIMN